MGVERGVLMVVGVGVLAVSDMGCWKVGVGRRLARWRKTTDFIGQPIAGYSGDVVQSYIGSLEAFFLNGVTPTTAHSLTPGLPE